MERRWLKDRERKEVRKNLENIERVKKCWETERRPEGTTVSYNLYAGWNTDGLKNEGE